MHQEPIYDKGAIQKRTARPLKSGARAVSKPKRGSEKDPIPPSADLMNEGRAKWAASVIGFLDRTRDDDYLYSATKAEIRSNQESKIADILADFAHYCDQNGFSIKRAIQIATRRYRNSTEHQGTQL